MHIKKRSTSILSKETMCLLGQNLGIGLIKLNFAKVCAKRVSSELVDPTIRIFYMLNAV